MFYSQLAAQLVNSIPQHVGNVLRRLIVPTLEVKVVQPVHNRQSRNTVEPSPMNSAEVRYFYVLYKNIIQPNIALNRKSKHVKKN